MFELKRISQEAVPDALERALRYRLLGEPLEAESICRDVLAVQPDNESAIVTLLLALTDQFARAYGGVDRTRAREVLAQLKGAYEQAYYEGIIDERWAKALLARGTPAGAVADWFRRAMRSYEKAMEHSPPDNPDAALRWNTCARFLQRQADHVEGDEQSLTRDVEEGFGDDVPLR
jgi:hypothetical protein